MATSSERSPPPFPADSEDQEDVLEEPRGRDSEEEDGAELFTSALETSSPLIDMDLTSPPATQPATGVVTPPTDIMDDPLLEPVVTPTETATAISETVISEVVSEPSDDFVDLTNNLADSPDDDMNPFADPTEEATTTDVPLDEPSEEFEDILVGSGSETEDAAVVVADVLVEAEKSVQEVTAPPAATTTADDEKTGSDAGDTSASAPLVDVMGKAEDGSAGAPVLDIFGEAEQPSAGAPFVDILGTAEESATVAPFVDIIGKIEEPASGAPVVDLFGEPEEVSAPAPVLDLVADLSAPKEDEEQPPVAQKIADPLVDFLNEEAPPPAAAAAPPAAAPPAAAPPAAAAAPTPVKPSRATVDLFEDDGNDLFSEPLKAKSSKQQKSLFGETDEDLFGEPLGAAPKKPAVKEQKEKEKPVPTRAPGDGSDVLGPLQDSRPAEAADIFTEEAVTVAPSIKPTTSVTSKTNGVHSEEEADLFAEATVELSLDSPQDERKKEKKEATSKPSASAAPSLSAAASMSLPQSAGLQELDEEEEEEQEDKFDIVISVKDPEKIGDGMNAYMAYKVSTQTSLLMFRNKTFTVRRRFSDFLGLYEKLSEKHGPNGYIVPPPPEKSILGMTKVKVGKEDSSSTDFVERRRGALERYLQRVVDHPSLLQDPDVREFLEREELPRAVSTQALSGAGFLKMLNKATDAVSKMTIKMNESDVWFEEKLQEVESADQQFRKLHALVESLVVHRKELSLNTASFAKSAAMLGSAEDNTALSRALSQLAEVEERMEALHQDQAHHDTFRFAEVIADYIRLLGAVRGSFDHRMKAWQRWQDAQTALQKKRETEAKLLWANKPDKLQLAKEEIAEWEAKVTQYERDFERVSATVRKEVVRFEKEKAKNFKRQIIKYLESLLQSQHQLIKYWEAFLPEAKAIA